MQYDRQRLFAGNRSATLMWDLRTGQPIAALDQQASVLALMFDDCRCVEGRHIDRQISRKQ